MGINIRDLARVGAKQRLAVLMKELRMLVKMFPGIADENAILTKKSSRRGSAAFESKAPRKKVVWSAARRKAQSERMKARNPKHTK